MLAFALLCVCVFLGFNNYWGVYLSVLIRFIHLWQLQLNVLQFNIFLCTAMTDHQMVSQTLRTTAVEGQGGAGAQPTGRALPGQVEARTSAETTSSSHTQSQPWSVDFLLTLWIKHSGKTNATQKGLNPELSCLLCTTMPPTLLDVITDNMTCLSITCSVQYISCWTE